MDKIKINPNRLMWCCETLGIDVSTLYRDIDIAQLTLEKAMKNQAVLSIKQLEKLANFFSRSLMFFLEPNDVDEEKIYSPQFRTINNQKPIHSRKLRAFIENVESQRKVYLSLLEDLSTPVSHDWQKGLDLNRTKIKKSSAIVRKWLGLELHGDFDDFRRAVEDKGIMVIVSNGYNGKWQIAKNNPVRGFSLYYETLPVIVIKKQKSKGAQAFTLFHELAHLLIHKESVIDDNEDFYSYQGKEKEANDFAGNILIPDDFLIQVDLAALSTLEIEEYDNFLTQYKSLWCVSGEAILVRLLNEKKITQVHYQAYKKFIKEQEVQRIREVERQKELGKPQIIPRNYRHREPVNMFGTAYVATVLDAWQNKHITLSKASKHLDNLKIHTLHKLEREIV